MTAPLTSRHSERPAMPAGPAVPLTEWNPDRWKGGSRARRRRADGNGAGQRERAWNLVQDTGYRRIRAALARTIHRVDGALAAVTRDRHQVLFEAATPMSLAVCRPVLAVLQRDPRLELWYSTFDRSIDACTLFATIGAAADHVLDAGRTTWRRFDAYINADFWDMTWLRRHTRRIHFFHGVAGKYGLDAPVRIAPLVAAFDRLMFANRDRLERYAEAGLVDADAPQAALVGYPKVDCLVDGSLDRDETAASLGLAPGVPTVLYAPTWSPHSSLSTMGAEVIGALAGLGLNVVVKLHDRSYDVTARTSGGVDWHAELDALTRKHQVSVATGADAGPYLHAADLLVTDHSSVGFEFMLLDRPIVTIDCPELIEKAFVSREKVAALQSASHCVERPCELRDAVARSLADPGEHHEQRARIAADLFYRPGTATARAAAVIYDLLGLSPCEAAAARVETTPHAVSSEPTLT